MYKDGVNGNCCPGKLTPNEQNSDAKFQEEINKDINLKEKEYEDLDEQLPERKGSEGIRVTPGKSEPSLLAVPKSMPSNIFSSIKSSLQADKDTAITEGAEKADSVRSFIAGVYHHASEKSASFSTKRETPQKGMLLNKDDARLKLLGNQWYKGRTGFTGKSTNSNSNSENDQTSQEKAKEMEG